MHIFFFIYNSFCIYLIFLSIIADFLHFAYVCGLQNNQLLFLIHTKRSTLHRINVNA